ncbi:MAG: type I methionyl aminopeptidase [Planctomycetota bacterium]
MAARRPFDATLTLRTPEEIDRIADAGRVVARALDAAERACAPGVTTLQINEAVADVLRDAGAESLFRGYIQKDAPPFAGEACLSINDGVVHGVPGTRVIAPGDLVTIDVGARCSGWCADAARSVLVPGGPDDDVASRLIEATRTILEHGAASMVPGRRWSEIGLELEAMAHETGCGIVTEYVGHGIGRDLHEAPKAPAYWSGFVGPDFLLEPGLVLAIEPILTSRPGEAVGPPGGGLPAWRTPVRGLDDGWTVVTADGCLACHEEHVVAVAPGGGRILTR